MIEATVSKLTVFKPFSFLRPLSAINVTKMPDPQSLFFADDITAVLTAGGSDKESNDT